MLSIFHYVGGGLAALFWCFFLAYPVDGRPPISESKKSERASDAMERSLQAESDFSAAIDVNGNRHRPRDYRPKTAPWLEEQRHAVAPWYPYYDRKDRHEGVGFYRLFLDVRTGAVSRIEMVKSTGYDSLDQATLKALRRWTWKPGRWKQIDLPVRFTISQHFRHGVVFDQPARLR